MRTYDHWIGGASYAQGKTAIERKSPAHGGALAAFKAGGKADVDLAVQAARRVFDAQNGWPNVPSPERAAVLQKLADLMEKNADRLAAIEAEEVGKPIRFARGEVAGAIELTRYAASLAWQISGDTFSQLGSDW
jgi:betaine-aldehyde dehydrogenase